MFKPDKEARNILQQAAVDKFLEKRKGTIVLPTGTGKTRIACMILKQL